MRTARPSVAVALVAISAAACGPRPIPTELARARAAYAHAAKEDSDPVRLDDAKRVLDAAEKRQREDPGSEVVGDLAYAAERKALVAESEARTSALREASSAMLALKRDDRRGPREQSGESTRSAKQDLASLSALAHVTEEQRGTVITLEASTLFGINGATLIPSGEERLDRILKTLRRVDGALTIIGHAARRDAKTAEERSGALARRRADAVADYLRDGGLPSRRVRVEARADEPARIGADERVEIVVRTSR